MKLMDRIAVITGAGSGIGRVSALEFAREGARVVVADINTPGPQDTVKQVQALCGQALAVETDVADLNSVQGSLRPPSKTSHRSTCSSTMRLFR